MQSLSLQHHFYRYISSWTSAKVTSLLWLAQTIIKNRGDEEETPCPLACVTEWSWYGQASTYSRRAANCWRSIPKFLRQAKQLNNNYLVNRGCNSLKSSNDLRRSTSSSSKRKWPCLASIPRLAMSLASLQGTWYLANDTAVLQCQCTWLPFLLLGSRFRRTLICKASMGPWQKMHLQLQRV